MESKSENPIKPTVPDTEPIKKKEQQVVPPSTEDLAATPATFPKAATTPENLNVATEMIPPKPPTPPTPPPPTPTMQTPTVDAKTPTPSTPTVEVQLPKVEVNPSSDAGEPDFTNATESQWQQFGNQISDLLDRLPDSVSNFFRNNQRPLTVVGVIIASIIALKVLSGLLDTFNEIPFFEPFFQLIGIIYSGWFVYRYLLNAASRNELWQIIDDYKAQVFGNKKP